MCALILMLGFAGILTLIFPPAGIIRFILVLCGHFVKFGKKQPKKSKQLELEQAELIAEQKELIQEMRRELKK
jgi:hypothetical protein